MDTIKKESLKVISRLPEETGIEEIMYRLYVLDKVKKGKDAVLKGEIVTIDELKKEASKW